MYCFPWLYISFVRLITTYHVIQFKIHLRSTPIKILSGFVQSLEFLKKSWHLPSSFLDLEKVWKIEIKTLLKKRQKVVTFFKVTHSISTLQMKFFFVLVESYLISPICLQHIMEKALFLHFFKVSIDHLLLFW